MTSGRSTAPSAAVLGSAEPRKREGCDDDEDNNRQNKRQRRDPRQADARSRTERSNRPTPGTNRTFNSRSLRQLQPPSTPHLYQSLTQSRPSRSTGNNNKQASCNKFFLRGFSGTDPVNRNAAENVLYKLSHPQCLADILAVAPHEMFSIARDVVDGVYHSISRFEDKEFRRNTPPGRELVGTIGLFVVPVLRGDPKPIDRADNYYLLPGPHDTDILVKIMPGLIINNDHHQHIMFKPLTTKHNTNPEDLRKSGELKRDFVLMRQTPRGNDDSDENDDSHTSEPPCFASLNFVATSDSYDYKSPCYMSITESQTYPRRCPWMDLGYPADVSDYVTLGKILEEASTRLAAPNLAKIAKLARNAPSKLSSNPTQETSPPKFPAKSTGALFQGQEELETLMTKTKVLPVDPDAEPLLPIGDTAVKLREGIANVTILEYVRNFGVNPKDAAAIQRLQVVNNGKSQAPTHNEQDAEDHQLQKQQVNAPKGKDDKGNNKRGNKEHRRFGPR